GGVCDCCRVDCAGSHFSCIPKQIEAACWTSAGGLLILRRAMSPCRCGGPRTVKRSSARILTSHTGVLNLPPAVGQVAGPRGERDEAAIARDVNEAVRLQVQIGMDVVNDGQLGGEGSLDLTFGAGLQGIEPKSVPEGTVVVPGSRTREGHELADF